MSLNVTDRVVEFLGSHPGERFTAKQIAEWIFQQYPDACRKKQARSQARVAPLDNDGALVSQIASEISSRKLRGLARRNIKTTEERPCKYYYSLKTDLREIEEAEREAVVAGSPIKEAGLYPVLSSFLWSELGLYSKRIDEHRSSNKNGSGGNKWLYPDMVAMENLAADWLNEIKNCVQNYADKKTRLWSFEVKILINRSRVC